MGTPSDGMDAVERLVDTRVNGRVAEGTGHGPACEPEDEGRRATVVLDV